MPGVTRSWRREIRVYLIAGGPLARKFLQRALARARCVKLLPGGLPRGNRGQCDLPDVIVAAWDPASSTASLLAALRRSAPKARILILGSRLARDTIVSLLRAGAHGFVDIEEVETDLLPAIRSLSEGRAWRRLEGFAVAAPPAAIREAWSGNSAPRFTPREVAVVALVRQGLSNKQIASELGITEATVKFHLKNIFVKGGVSDRHALAGVAVAGAVETRDQTPARVATHTDACPSGRG